jgi:hypothetical protein
MISLTHTHILTHAYTQVCTQLYLTKVEGCRGQQHVLLLLLLLLLLGMRGDLAAC